LAPGGRFVVCAAAFQGARVVAGARSASLAIETQVDVVPREGKSTLFAVYAMRRAGDAARTTDLPARLVVRDRRAQWTPELAALRTAMGMPSVRG
jgi:tRNA1(Val) A37 N6-methylase TrmN6